MFAKDIRRPFIFSKAFPVINVKNTSRRKLTYNVTKTQFMNKKYSSKISRSDQSSAHYIKCKAKIDKVQEISLTMHTDKTKFEKNNRFRRRL